MNRQPSKGRIALNVLSNWAGQFVALALGFFAAPFVVSRLGDSAYGVWILMASIAGYLGLMDLGVRGAVTRYTARFSASGDGETASRTVSSALQIFSATAVAAVLVSLALAMLAIDHLDIPEGHRAAARMVLLLTGFNVGVSLVTGTFSGIVAALQRFDLLNLADTTIGVARTGGTVLALLAGQGIVAMAVIHLVLALFRGLWFAWLCRRLYPTLRINLRVIDPDHLRLIFSFSLLSFLIHVSGRLIYYTDALVIAAFLPIGLLTFFSIGGSLVEYARTLISSVSYTTSPMASSLDGAGEHGRIRTLLTTSARFSTMILLPVAVTFLFRGSSFIGLWMGEAYAESSGHVLAILSLPLLFHAGTHGAGGIMLGIGKHKPMVFAMLVEAAANVALSVALVQTMGIAGVAWGTAIPSLVSSVAFWPWYVRRAVGVPVSDYLKLVWIRPWAATVPFALGTAAVERLWPASTMAQFFVQVGLCLIPAGGMYWWVCFSRSDRQAVLAVVRGRLHRHAQASAL